MNNFEKNLEVAKKKIFVADYMLSNTYSLLKDPKVLIAILENIYDGFENSLSCLIGYERFFKRVPPYSDSFESKMNVYSLKVQKRYDLDADYSITLMKMREILDKRKDAPVEFSRNEKFVIATDKFDLSSISEKDLKDNLAKAKTFLKKVESITGGHDA